MTPLWSHQHLRFEEPRQVQVPRKVIHQLLDGNMVATPERHLVQFVAQRLPFDGCLRSAPRRNEQSLPDLRKPRIHNAIGGRPLCLRLFHLMR